jgi:hypothetical protein
LTYLIKSPLALFVKEGHYPPFRKRRLAGIRDNRCRYYYETVKKVAVELTGFLVYLNVTVPVAVGKATITVKAMERQRPAGTRRL